MPRPSRNAWIALSLLALLGALANYQSSLAVGFSVGDSMLQAIIGFFLRLGILLVLYWVGVGIQRLFRKPSPH